MMIYKMSLLKTDEKITETNTELKVEIRTFGEVKIQAQVNLNDINDVKDINELKDAILSEIKTSVEKLIEECKKYRG